MGNPTCHQWKQRKLIGEGFAERKDILDRANSLVSDLLADKPDGEDAATHHQKLKQTGKLREKLKEKVKRFGKSNFLFKVQVCIHFRGGKIVK